MKWEKIERKEFCNFKWDWSIIEGIQSNCFEILDFNIKWNKVWTNVKGAIYKSANCGHFLTGRVARTGVQWWKVLRYRGWEALIGEGNKCIMKREHTIAFHFHMCSRLKKIRTPVNSNVNYHRETKLISISMDSAALIWCFNFFLRGPSSCGGLY